MEKNQPAKIRGKIHLQDELNLIIPQPSKEPPDKSLILTSFFNVPYATRSISEQLDVYIPTSDEKPFPVFFWMHGGGWSFCDKQEDGPVCSLPEKCRIANTATYVRSNCPPFFIIHGKADIAVHYTQALFLQKDQGR